MSALSPESSQQPLSVLRLRPELYRCHPLHAEDRAWRESNCAADLWIEALHALGCDPTLALGFTLSADFDGEQWRMFKFDPADLRALYGIEFDELNVWRPLEWHLRQQIELGRMVTVDVDAWHLPDTAGLTYGVTHQKTTVLVQMIDPRACRLGYFHNTGYHELAGADYDAILGRQEAPRLPPYVEAVRLDRLRVPGATTDRQLTEPALELAREHLARRPTSDPISRMATRIRSDLQWISAEGLDTFHRYAFGSLRQCGSGAELAASYVDRLSDSVQDARLGRAAHRLRTVSTTMKALEFQLARVVRGRAWNLDPAFAGASQAWEEAITDVAAGLG